MHGSLLLRDSKNLLTMPSIVLDVRRLSTNQLWETAMRAAVLTEVNKPLEILDLKQDGPKAGEARVKVRAAGVCMSDWHIMNGDWPLPLPMERKPSSPPLRCKAISVVLVPPLARALASRWDCCCAAPGRKSCRAIT